GAWVKLIETATVCAPAAPALIVIACVRAPAAAWPATDTVTTCTAPGGSVPLAEESATLASSETAVHVSVVPPPLLTVRSCVGGAAGACAVNASEAGFTSSLPGGGGGACTMAASETCCSGLALSLEGK